jgi:RimJ/RimL family protein N-acetyltransferase
VTTTRKRRRKPARVREFRVRRARPSDREPILEMSKHIWGGNDYMPLVWDRWLAEKKGALLTATADGRPVGTSKVTLLSPGEVWLEGLRLHPDFHGLGLSKKIHRATFREASKLNPRTVRYSTWMGNEASRRIAEKNDFWQIARTGWMWSKADQRRRMRSRRATLDDLDDLTRFVLSSDCYEATGGVAGVGWTFPQLTRRRIRRLVSKEQALILPRRGAPRAVAIFDIGKIDDDVCLGFVDGSDDDVTALAHDIRRVAADTGRSEASAMLPMGRLVDIVRAAGFDQWQPVRAVVYELGARGISGGGESFEEVVSRTLRLNEPDVLDAVAEMLAERAPARLAKENVRDFIARNLIPDTDRLLISSTQSFFVSLRTDLLRTILRGVIEHLYQRYGLVVDAPKATSRNVGVKHMGRRIASLRATASSLRLTLGPGFGACFPRDLKVRVGDIRFVPKTLDSSTGRYEAVVLTLTEKSHVSGARKAIDLIMKSAAKNGRRR